MRDKRQHFWPFYWVASLDVMHNIRTCSRTTFRIYEYYFDMGHTWFSAINQNTTIF